MALGQVNVPGSAGTDAAAARQLAAAAQEKANAAMLAAQEAKATASAAMKKAADAEEAAGEAGTKADAAMEKAEGVENSVASAEAAASAAQETANAAKQTAEAAATTAANAQQTANAAAEAVAALTSTINTIPSQSGTLTYTGSAQSPVWNGYDTEKLTMGGVTSGTDAGTYTATFTPKDGYKWSDGTADAVSVTWTISKASLTVPSQSGTLTYTGSAQSPTWSSYDSTKMTVGGTTSGTDAGSYTATFTPGANYQWSDGTTIAKSVTWSIAKAAGSLSLSATSLTLDISTLTGSVTATRPGDGTISATSSNTSVATVSVTGTTVKVTGVAAGSATITVKVAAGTNHTAPSNKTIAVTVSLPSKILSSNTPDVIQAAAQAGQAANLWSAGDKVPIELSGTVGALSLNGTYYAFIIGFDHNSSIEGTNTIHFQFGKNASGTDIAFVDGNYNSTDSSAGFRMNTSNTNSGGWASSYMRQTICPAFLAAMPTAWQNVIAACTKYSDNTGGGNGSVSGQVTSTSDKIFCLSEYEVHGAITYSNSYEANYQKQYDYYANGNSKVKYQHSATGSACYWWLRSVYASGTYRFCCVYTDGTANISYADSSRGFAPGFKVA